jgi:hypothetical protein
VPDEAFHRTGIDIEPPAEVWRRLADLAAYADWNPFISAASGVPEVGRMLSLGLQSPHGRGITIARLRRSLDGSTRAGFEAMNAALRRRARVSHPAPDGPTSPVTAVTGRLALSVACAHGGYTNSAIPRRS